MPVLAKFCGIVIRMMVGTTIGTRLHAFHDGAELVVALNPLRVIQSEVPPWVEEQVLHWIHKNRRQLLSPCCQVSLPPAVLTPSQGHASPTSW